MKAKIITIGSGICILALGIFAVLQLNAGRRALAMFALALSLVPMYFIYAAAVLNKYRDNNRKVKIRPSEKNYGYRNKYRDVKIKKAANDYGKVLEFPKDKQNTKNKKI